MYLQKTFLIQLINNNFKVYKLILFFSLLAFSVKTQPVTEWVQRYNSPGNYNDYVNDMVVDSQGNVYLTGYSNGDFLTIKYNTAGEIKWVKTYDGPYHGNDKALAIALDKNLDVYVLGESANLYGKNVYSFVKYSNAGEQLWAREYINQDSIGAYPHAFTVDDSGNVYGTGYFNLPNYNSDYGTVKYNTNGLFQWVRTFGGTANSGDFPFSITTDKYGNTLITGVARDSGNIKSIATIKYDSFGNTKWIKRYFYPNSGYREGSKIKIDKNNNIFVGGYGEDETNTEYKFILIKYDTSGTEKWVRTYGCTSGYNPAAYIKDLTIDNLNDILVTGLSDSNQIGWEFTTLKYNNDGDWLWIKRFRKSFNSSNSVNAITTDKYNNVYVTGKTDNNTPWNQYLTVKYLPDSTFSWAVTYNNSISYNYNHEAVKIKTDSAGNIYVTGNSEENGTYMDIATIKYTDPSRVRNISNEIPLAFKLFQNYPNPFNPSTNIKYQIKENSFVTLKIFDILGKEIAVIVNEKQKPGSYEVQFDARHGGSSSLPSGVYYYVLYADGVRIDARKMLMIK